MGNGTQIPIGHSKTGQAVCRRNVGQATSQWRGGGDRHQAVALWVGEEGGCGHSAASLICSWLWGCLGSWCQYIVSRLTVKQAKGPCGLLGPGPWALSLGTCCSPRSPGSRACSQREEPVVPAAGSTAAGHGRPPRARAGWGATSLPLARTPARRQGRGPPCGNPGRELPAGSFPSCRKERAFGACVVILVQTITNVFL